LRKKFFVPPRWQSALAPAWLRDPYSKHNFKGFFGSLRSTRFEAALQLAGCCQAPARRLAVEIGCADGYLLPSLSAYFERVLALDIEQVYVRASEELVERNRLANVQVLQVGGNLEGLGPLAERADVVFCLEVLEHIFQPGAEWEAREVFLDTVKSRLLKPGGVLVASVPVEVGPSLLIKETLRRLRQRDSRHRLAVLLAASVYRTDDYQQFEGTHWGFDYRRLIELVSRKFHIQEVRFLPPGVPRWLAATVIVKARAGPNSDAERCTSSF
jgi:2-polyprenyl-3-methyl-5-hydroxy-6-metoxy-1,4-benzoquinol methylase